ncbi:MAG: SBBP repeat-containing protein [Candidatus Aminicenantes bacterium]
MKRYFILIFLFIIFFRLLLAIVPVKSEQVPDVQSADAFKGSLRPDINFGKIPLYFVANQGQVNEKAVFYAKTSRYTLWLTKEGLVFDSMKKVEEVEQDHSPSPKFYRDVSRFVFLDANKSPGMVPVEESKLKVNYFKGKDKSKWHSHIPTSQAVLYKSLYKNIDLKLYGIEKEIEYDWIVKPGGNPEDIKFQYKNVKGTRLDEEGNLLIETNFGQLLHKKPVSYQKRQAPGAWRKAQSACPYERSTVNVTFKKIAENIYGFEVGEYDNSRELIIDPVVLAYSTYLGGDDKDYGFGIAVDGSGCAYVTGYTLAADFPTRDEYQADFQGDTDAFITRLDTTKSGASSLIYSTYLGGGSYDYGRGIAVDGSGCAYVIGETWSSDFPTLDEYQADLSGYVDVFIIKLDTTKNGASSLTYSTYLGGDSQDWGGGIAVDGSDCAYVTGYTESSNFPTLNQYQADQGDEDAFLTKLDTTKSGASSLVYSTYLGGGSYDYGRGIAVDGSGCAYVTGYTLSSDFPTLNQYQAYQGDSNYDAFVTRLDTTKSGASSLIYSTYLVGSAEERGWGIAVDSSGNAYVTGYTRSSDFPTLNQYLGEIQGPLDAFLTKLDTTKSGASTLVYSTYLGGSSYDLGSGIAVDGSGCAYVTGNTTSPDFPILDEYQADLSGYYDAFITKLDTTKNGPSSLIYSTYLGGSKEDHGNGIAVDGSGCAYVIGDTLSTDFPTLNRYQEDQQHWDVFITKLVLCKETPSIQLNRTRLYYGAVSGGWQTGPQSFTVDISGGCDMQWTASCQENWIQFTPTKGAGSTLVTVSVDSGGLTAGTYTGTISITSGSASESVSVILTIYDTASTSVPFGEFSTPPDASVARGSIPVTGWVLDDMEVESVKIYRDGSVYVGDAVFVEGARPDVEAAFPGYPFNYRAGWGYMLLTNFFPNNGNGTYTLYAAATDVEGNTVTLGAKTIVCDNENAVKPFGTIDTPAQGGTASGSGYINWGWALTPQPNSIPTDGRTIHVWVDGINMGNPVYNIFRSDIAALFPGYANSSGAVGYFYLDTTAYANGIHTIQWTVTDSGGNTDGIGSRYFIIQNPGSTKKSSIHNLRQNPTHSLSPFPRFAEADLLRQIQEHPFTGFESIPADPDPVLVRTGFDNSVPLQSISPDDSGIVNIVIPPAGRVEIRLWPLSPGNNGFTAGCQEVGNWIRPLPPGSTLDTEKGVFYWQPVSACMGSFDFLFVNSSSPEAAKKIRIMITIMKGKQPLSF